MAKAPPLPKPKPTDALGTIAELVQRLLRSYTREPEHLRVDSGDLGGVFVLAVKVGAADYPSVCGKQGSHIIALQTIVDRYARARGRNSRVTLLQSTAGSCPEIHPFVTNPEWQPDNVKELMGLLCRHVMPPHSAFRLAAVGELWHIMVRLGGNPDPGLIHALDELFQEIGKIEGCNLHVMPE